MSYFGSAQNPNHGQLIRPGTPIQSQLFNPLQFGQPEPGGFDHGTSHLQLLQPQQQQQQPQPNFSNLNVNFLADQIMSQAQNSNLLGSMGLQAASLTGFSGAPTMQQQVPTSTQSPSNQPQQGKQRVFTGTVTKTHDNFGFIDEEVFFQMGVVKGPILPKAGDRVLVEADFNSAMPFKWNATRVQIVNIGASSPTNKPQVSPQPMTTTSVSRTMPPPPILSNVSRHTNNANHGGSIMSSASSDMMNYNQQQVPIISNPHSTYNPTQQQHQQNTSSAGMSMSSYQQPQRGNPTQQQIRPAGRPMQMQQPVLASSDSVLPMQYQSSGVSASSVQSHTSQVAKLGDLMDDVKDRDRARESRDRDRDRETGRDRERSRSRDRRDKDRRSDRDRRDRERRRSPVRSPVRSPPRKSSREDSRRRDRSRDDVRRRERSREKDKGRTRDLVDRQVIVSSPASSSSRKRSHSRERESRSTKEIVEKSSKNKSRSPSPRRRQRQGRYAVDIPKANLNMADLDILELKRRYPNIHMPSDLFLAKLCWWKTLYTSSFKPSILSTNSSPVYIFRKHPDKIELGLFKKGEKDASGQSLSKVERVDDFMEPVDANFIFSVKVLLLSVPDKKALYQKCCGLAEDGDETKNLQHLTKLINFVVGTRSGKSENAGIGGAWSESLDGENPQSNPQVLINTAVRTFKTFTGVDLSSCNTWYRFMELYYKRDNGVLETVVYFLPDTLQCSPTSGQWTAINSAYKWVFHGDEKEAEDDKPNQKPTSQLKDLENTNFEKNIEKAATAEDNVLKSNESKPPVDDKIVAPSKDVTEVQIKADPASENWDITSADGDGNSTTGEVSNAAVVTETKENAPTPMETSSIDLEMKEDSNAGMDTSNVSITTDASEAVGSETHDNTMILEPNRMTVAKLKQELASRNLSTKGLKPQLIKRLTEAIVNEIAESSPKPGEKIDTTEATSASATAPTVTESQKNGNEISTESSAAKPVEQNVTPIDVSTEKLEEDNKSTIINTAAVVTTPVVEELPPTPEIVDPLEILVPILTDDMDDRTKRIWERRYTLPTRPHLLIHPPSNFKDFDCTQLSLASLKDVSSSDSKSLKESSFELVLFAELFHGMLQYGFGAQIFKEIVERSELKDEKPTDEEKKDDKKISAATATDSDGSSDSKKRKLSTDSKSKITKLTTVNPELLLAFSYFDLNHSGNITEVDLEDLCFSLGIAMNRAQVRKMIRKVVSKGTLNYRQWTDKAVKENELSTDVGDSAKTDHFFTDKFQTFVKGNKVQLPVFVYPSEVDELDGQSDSLPGIGSMDIGNLRNQVLKFEKDRVVQEVTLNMIQNRLNQSRNQASELKKSNESLKTELEKTKEALKKAEATSKTTQENLETFKNATEKLYDRVGYLIKIPSITTKDKDTTSKSMESKDKDGGSNCSTTSSSKSNEDGKSTN